MRWWGAGAAGQYADAVKFWKATGAVFTGRAGVVVTLRSPCLGRCQARAAGRSRALVVYGCCAMDNNIVDHDVPICMQ